MSEDGTVITYGKGFAEPVYQCACGRMQTAIGSLQPICPETVQLFGWRRTDDGWSCPFCSGNEHRLKRVIGNQMMSREEFEAYGRRPPDGH